MTSFYKPIVFRHSNFPVILYPYRGIETQFDRNQPTCLERHVSQLLAQHPDKLQNISYIIVILWTMNTDVMTDVWLFGQLESWEAGPTIFVTNFKNEAIDTMNGVTAGDGMLLLGREEELRRSRSNIHSYIFGARPSLPFDLTPTEDFYV